MLKNQFQINIFLARLSLTFKRQKFGTVSENKVLRKWKLSKSVDNKYSPKLIFIKKS